MNFANTVLTWYNNNKEDFPWRMTKDPYKIWVSEIMLQQTQVQTVIPYYKKWINKFPTIFDVANASDDILFKTVGWGITLCFIGVVAGAIGVWEIPEESQRLFDMGFGAVVAAFTQVIGYYFGSSAGSKHKTNIMGGNGKSN